MRARRLPALLAAALAAGATGAAAAGVPVWIVNPGAAAAIEIPVGVGLPLPAGLVRSPDPAFELRLAAGERRAVQTTVLERWPDGSARWVLADVVLPGAPPGRSSATLERTAVSPRASGIEASAGPPITIRSAHLAVAVAPTGSLAVRLLGSAAPDVVVDPIDVDTGRDGPSRVTAVRVASAGPVRAEIVVERTHPGGVTAHTHVVAWAGSTTLLVRHRIVNLTGTPAAELRAEPVVLHVPGIEEATVLLDGAARPIDTGAGPVRLAQTDPSAATANGDAIGARLDGAATVRTPALALTAVVPDFWQQYPKALTVSGDALEIDLVAGGATPVALGIGAAKQHDVWLRLERTAAVTPLAALASLLQHPPRAIAPPSWTRASRALRGVVDPETPAARTFLARLRSDALRYESRSRHERWDAGPPGPCSARTTADPRTGFFGVLNWGDWNFPGYRDGAKECDAWGNLEYDLPLVFGLAWASTADPLWAGWFERAVAHYRDVDVIHAAPAHPEWVGLNHPHKVGHFDWEARSKIDLGHVWLEGLLLHHRLTGDARSGHAATEMARRLGELTAKARNARQFGWPMIALAAVADATGEPAIRDAALRYARLAIDRFEPDPALGDWKLGVLASGLAAVHRATGDPAARDWLLAYGVRLLADERVRERDPRYLAIAGHLAAVTGDARWADLATSLASDLPSGTWGKTLAMHGRVGFELLAHLPERPPPRP